MKRFVCTALIATFIGVTAAPARAELALTDNDRVIFFGGTELSDLYFTYYMDLFLRVRYPKLNAELIRMGLHNSDSADGLQRLKAEVLTLNPTQVVLCFGLEEPDRKDFDKNRYDAYLANMTTMIDRLQNAGIRVSLMTPPPPEESANTGLANKSYARQIESYAKGLAQIAEDRSLPLLDWHEAVLTYQSAHDPNREKRYTMDGLKPLPISAAIASDMLLSHWQAKPLDFVISTSWTEKKPVELTVGTGSVSDRKPRSMRIALRNIPVPVDMSMRGNIPPEKWPMTKWISYRLRIPDLPDAGVLITSTGIPGMHYPADVIRQGADMSVSSPFTQHVTSRNLHTYAQTKIRQFGEYVKALIRPVPHPELEDAYSKYAEAELATALGVYKVFHRVPASLTLRLDLKLLDADELAAAKSNLKKPRRGLRRRPGRQRD